MDAYFASNRYEESYACIQKCKSFLRGDLGGIKALSGVVSVLDSTQDLLCKKLTNHFVALCLNAEGTTATKEEATKKKHRKHRVKSAGKQEGIEEDVEDVEDAEDAEDAEDEDETMMNAPENEDGKLLSL